MSGIFGCVRSLDIVRAEEAAALGARFVHRPQQVITIDQPAPNLAVGRIGIGILNGTPQPVRATNCATWLWLCGEFYHQASRRSELVSAGRLAPDAPDEALALAVWEEGGADGIAKLEGAFVVAVWDAAARVLWLVNDRFGLYPHYFACLSSLFVFGPEMHAILSIPGMPERLDLVAVAQYVRFQQMLGDRTWSEDIRRLPPASILSYCAHDGALTIRRYWSLEEIPRQPRLSFDEAVEGAADVLQRAVREMAKKPGRLGVFLSGGLDSRSILAVLPPEIPAQTLTYGAPGSRDVEYARRVARRAGRPHFWLPFQDGRWVLDYADLHLTLTDGFHSWLHAHGISMLDEARSRIDVNLSGWDGGTIFSGSLDHGHDARYRDAVSAEDLVDHMFEGFCRRFTWPGLLDSEFDRLCGGHGDRRLKPLALESLREELKAVATYPPGRLADYFYVRHVVLRSLQYQIVVLRSAIEVRCPYFDYALVDFMYSLPDVVRTSPYLRRAVLTRRAPHLALIPYEKDDRLPHANSLVRGTHALGRRLKGLASQAVPGVFRPELTLYADYEQYLRTDLRQWAERILFSEQASDRGLFDPAMVRALWERHLSGVEQWTVGKVAPLITIELALRRFFDPVKVAAAERSA